MGQSIELSTVALAILKSSQDPGISGPALQNPILSLLGKWMSKSDLLREAMGSYPQRQSAQIPGKTTAIPPPQTQDACALQPTARLHSHVALLCGKPVAHGLGRLVHNAPVFRVSSLDGHSSEATPA